MKEPIRLRAEGTARPEARALLEHARPTRSLPNDVRQRSGRRVRQLLLVPISGGVVGYLAGAALAGVGVTGAVVAVRALHSPPAAEQYKSPAGTPAAGGSDRLVTAAPTPTSTPVPPVEAPAPATSAASAHRPPAPAAPASAPVASAEADSLSREVGMLESARAQLATNPLAALNVLDGYAAAFPSGAMTMERELLAVEALRRLGRTDEARTRGEALLRHAQGSLYEPRIRGVLGSLPK